MMTAICISFIFGALVPYMARRFAKFMPATPAYALYRLIKPNKVCGRKNAKYYKLRKAYMLRSIMYAIVTSVLAFLISIKFGNEDIWWRMIFLWSLVLLSEVDIKTLLLPDIVTFPLLILGFCFVTLSGADLSPSESAIAAMVGYVIPVVATLFLLWRSHDAFGGGDIKLLAAIGAWLGVDSLLYTILLSCALFGGYSILKSRKDGAFGPALSLAAILVWLIF